MFSGDGPVRAAEEALTRGSRRHRAWTVRRLALGASARPPSDAFPGDAWCREVEREVRGAGGMRGGEGVLPSGDQKRVALRGHVHAVPGMVQTMPTSASTPISQLRGQKGMEFASLCAKIQALQLCRSKFSQIRKLVRPKFSKNSTDQKGKNYFVQVKHFFLAKIFPRGVGMPCAGV